MIIRPFGFMVLEVGFLMDESIECKVYGTISRIHLEKCCTSKVQSNRAEIT